ncbi:nuclear transport factor 2 family protein [Burkholderia sp. Ac-20379]|uniref:nuclear transport factor 2 family protein n=1 Tax=Burkholderia sp. Ac-20379 TaxID=2703900 RepID=UPI00197D0D55|nr:nuclear transport factor 2 family protein [Burkholderia sp. Ac-20379]MBN3725009.1 nuclear transport factor 2 family protein [Burkholderia sp. Ac-20379]
MPAPISSSTEARIRHIHAQWHAAIVARDVEALMSLYADHAHFESPSVLAIGLAEDASPTGNLAGKAAIRHFFAAGFTQLGNTFTDWYRTGDFFSNGVQLVWEYPRATPTGEQTDLVEFMDIEGGLIVAHRVYWGWRGLQSLLAVAEARRRA